MSRVVLVTGGGRGIGASIVRAFAPDHVVAFTYFQAGEDAAALCAELPDALAIEADLAEPGAIDLIVSQVRGRFGQLDVLVNNAAIVNEGTTGLDVAGHREMNAVNLEAPVALTAACLPLMEDGASVINITSGNATRPPAVVGGYAATKAAMEAWTKAAARELGPRGIRVNAVAPGPVERDYKPRPESLLELIRERTALPGIAVPEDIAPAVRFLASDGARFITGAVLPVDGGFGL